MQLSSLCLAATALLAQASSASYLLNSSHPSLKPFGFAAINHDIHTDPVGLFQPTQYPYAHAAIDLDADGNLVGRFKFHQVADGEWQFVAGRSVPTGPNDITGPFAFEADQFVYKGEGGGVWNACFHSERAGVRGHIIVLATAPIQREGCVADVTLMVTKNR
ncbi:hypothetical protein C8A01DRAFT_38182 [Parachaetomium inaequale]|uniref:Uncharacterized protein n=1 Tax=Parachaetomium inaequale TaxID=2588326 RepID=A0AAN6SPV4_9PEZI|nr:hypothetical protein C8A01DRAFT_38182 [Parachaetomium inaequale]